VANKDTFWTLAAKNGVTVAEIEAANPTLSKYSLMPGMKVVIPPPSTGADQQAPTPTALPILVDNPVCSPSLTGGLYCFALTENNQSMMLQYVSGQFTITDSQSGVVQVQPALLPLDHLPVGDNLPLYAYFPPPVASSYQVTLQLFSALPDDGSNSSYLALTITASNVEISSDGLSAAVTGSVSSAAEAARFNLAAVAYDSSGNVVAVRQLENKNGLAAGASADFKLYVYSIAGKIDHVSIFGEAARPD
jgi:LysM repeat protein